MKNTHNNHHLSARRFALVTALAFAAAFSTASVYASSHSDAPLIKLDPQANLTDVYAFIDTNNAAG